MFVGHGGVGKTNLKRSLLGEKFNEIHDCTIGIDASKVEITHAHDWKQQTGMGTLIKETCNSMAFFRTRSSD